MTRGDIARRLREPAAGAGLLCLLCAPPLAALLVFASPGTPRAPEAALPDESVVVTVPSATPEQVEDSLSRISSRPPTSQRGRADQSEASSAAGTPANTLVAEPTPQNQPPNAPTSPPPNGPPAPTDEVASTVQGTIDAVLDQVPQPGNLAAGTPLP